MVSKFYGRDEENHKKFQAWRKNNVDGFHMTETNSAQYTIHYTQDKRENNEGRGCIHQGGSNNEYLEDKNCCYTTAQKVCSNSFAELVEWASKNGFTTRNCKHCDTKQFPFPKICQNEGSHSGEINGASGLMEGARKKKVKRGFIG